MSSKQNCATYMCVWYDRRMANNSILHVRAPHVHENGEGGVPRLARSQAGPACH